MESEAPYRYEYVRGEIRAMSGGTDYHGVLLESLQDYLLVSQRVPRIEMHTRKDDGRWDDMAAEGPDGILPLSALAATLSLADIYNAIDPTTMRRSYHER